MDITVANEWLPWFYKIFPVTLAQLQALRGSNSLYQVGLDYAFWFFGISGVCLLSSAKTMRMQRVFAHGRRARGMV